MRTSWWWEYKLFRCFLPSLLLLQGARRKRFKVPRGHMKLWINNISSMTFISAARARLLVAQDFGSICRYDKRRNELGRKALTTQPTIFVVVQIIISHSHQAFLRLNKTSRKKEKAICRGDGMKISFITSRRWLRGFIHSTACRCRMVIWKWRLTSTQTSWQSEKIIRRR